MESAYPVKEFHGDGIRCLRSELGAEIIDFSANLNPFVPEIDWNPCETDYSSYPDDSYGKLRDLIAGRFGRDAEEVCLGNGSVELIRSFCHLTLGMGKKFHVFGPTFSEYALSAQLAGAQPSISKNDADAWFFCNPNNPSGKLVLREEVKSILYDCTDAGAVLLLDEAFIDLSDPSQSMAGDKEAGLFVVRSLTKCFSVPGIRFGYGFAEPALAGQIEVMRPPWSVNSFAESYAIAAFEKYDLLDQSREKICKEKEWLYSSLQAMDLRFERSAANFILITMPIPAKEICSRMIRESVFVRDCSSFGLPNCIRIAVRTRNENRILIEALEKCLR